MSVCILWVCLVNIFILTDKNSSTFSYVLIKVQAHSDKSTTVVFLPVVLLLGSNKKKSLTPESQNFLDSGLAKP